MRRFAFILLCCLSFVFAYADDPHPEGDCQFRTKWGDLVSLSGNIRLVGPNEMADVYVRVWQKGDNVPSGTPEMVVSVVDGTPDWCGEFRIVNSGEDYTVKLVEDGSCADIVVVLGEPRKSYPQGVAF